MQWLIYNFLIGGDHGHIITTILNFINERDLKLRKFLGCGNKFRLPNLAKQIMEQFTHDIILFIYNCL